jgi:xeroderma pigmentosum group C-complementing protein
MLAEAVPSLAKSDTDGKTIKKRRVGGRIVTYGVTEVKAKPSKREDTAPPPFDGNVPARVEQTVYNDSAGSSEEDLEWEEVDLNQALKPSLLKAASNPKDNLPLEIRLDGHTAKGKAPAIQRRKPVTGSEKRMRLEVHKAHLLCLIAHVYIRNHWCNDVGLQVNTLDQPFSKIWLQLTNCANRKTFDRYFRRTQDPTSILKKIKDNSRDPKCSWLGSSRYSTDGKRLLR